MAEESKISATPLASSSSLTPAEAEIADRTKSEIEAGLLRPFSVAVVEDIMEDVARIPGLPPAKRRAMIKRIAAHVMDTTSDVYSMQDDIVSALKSAAKQRFGFGTGQGQAGMTDMLPSGPVREVVAAMVNAASDPTLVTGTQRRQAADASLSGTASRIFQAGLGDALVEYASGSTDLSAIIKQSATAAVSHLALEAAASGCFGLCKKKKKKEAEVTGAAPTPI